MTAINVLAEKSFGMGLAYSYCGKFDSKEELLELVKEWYPWELDKKGEKEILDNLMERKQHWIYSYDIDLLVVVKNKLYARLNDVELLDSIADKIIYDTEKKNYLLAFSNNDWLYVNAAIDLATGTVGLFNSEENNYYPVKEISMNDIELLEEILQENEITVDWSAEVKRGTR